MRRQICYTILILLLVTTTSAQSTFACQFIDTGADYGQFDTNHSLDHMVAWSPTDRLIATAASVGVWLHNPSDMDAEAEFISSGDRAVTAISFHPNGNYLVIGYSDWTVSIFELPSLDEFGDMQNSFIDFILDIEFHPMGDMVAITSNSREIAIYETTNWQEIYRGNGFGDVEFSHDGEFLANALDSSVELYRVEDLLSDDTDAEAFQIIEPSTDNADSMGVYDLLFSPSDDTIYIAGRDISEAGIVQAWDVTSGEKLHDYIGHRLTVHTLAMTSDGEILISGGRSVRIWNTESTESVILPTFNVNEYLYSPRIILDSAINSDSSLLVTVSGDSRVQIWNLDTQELVEYCFSSTAE